MSRPAVTGDPSVSHSDDAVVLLAWITLTRVVEGSVTKQGDKYLDGGAALPPYLVVPVTTLLTEGLLAVADADPAGWCPVVLTEAGRIRREQLRRRGALALQRAWWGGHPVMADDGDGRSRGDAVVLGDPEPDPRAAGACDVRLPASSVEPVAGVSPALRVAGLGNHDADQSRPIHQHKQRGSTLQPEGTRLPRRVPGTHLHPQLRLPPSGAGPSPRAGSQA